MEATLERFTSAGAQRSRTWKQERAGYCTGSEFKSAMAFKKGARLVTHADARTFELKARADYRLQCVVERLTGIPSASFSTRPMERGIELEPTARLAYEEMKGVLVEESDFVPHPTLEWCGVSVDGLVGEDGTIEIKCPNPETHLRTILLRNEALAKVLGAGVDTGDHSLVPEEHLPQIQGGLWVTGRKWCDFISYDSRFPEHLRLYVQRVERNDAYIQVLEQLVGIFLNEVEDALSQLLGVNA
jgi:hypothetical protein